MFMLAFTRLQLCRSSANYSKNIKTNLNISRIRTKEYTAATTAASKNLNLIYVGPVNQMVSRMKYFSIGSALASTAFAPALIYFSASHWSLFAKIGLVSSGKTIIKLKNECMNIYTFLI